VKSGFQSVTHQGYFARKYKNAKIEDCPYPQHCLTAKEWRGGWNAADKGEPWSQPRRKVRVEE
jgi:hypothetical protein